jgi:hypothetical protein
MSSLYIYIYTYECVSKLAQRPSGGLFLASVLRPDECQICFTASPQSAEFVVTRAVLDRFLCISPCSHLLPPAPTCSHPAPTVLYRCTAIPDSSVPHSLPARDCGQLVVLKHDHAKRNCEDPRSLARSPTKPPSAHTRSPKSEFTNSCGRPTAPHRTTPSP